MIAIRSRFRIVTPATCFSPLPSNALLANIRKIEETSVPNRRRRKLSTAMSAVAALAVASPFAAVAVAELTGSTPAPQQHEFTPAAVVTDLPNEIISAISQGLAQFGINVPPLPTGLSPAGAQPVSTSPILTTPSALTPLGTPALGSTTPSTGVGTLTPALATPPLSGDALTNPALTPALTAPAGTPILATPSADTTGLTNPAAGTPILATPSLGAPDPALTAPGALPTLSPSLGLPSEQPISTPIGLDPMAGSYPILGGDPSLAIPTAPVANTGVIGDLSSLAQQLGAGQAIDLIKGIVMPSIMSAIQQATPAAPAAAAATAASATAPVVVGAAEAVPAVAAAEAASTVEAAEAAPAIEAAATVPAE
jgi:hypothetical protein